MLSLIQVIGALEMGFIYALVAIGVYLSFRTLQFPDLTVDGSFPLGAAVSAAMIVAGYDPLVATLAAILAGAIAGLITAWMSTHLKMLNLLASILTMTALYSINLRIMGGRPNIALLGEKTILSKFPPFLSDWGILMIIVILVALVVYWFLSTQIGLGLRATGSNARMARAQGIADHRMIWLGLSLSNALVALGGSIFTQKLGFADVSMGVGTIISGLAAVIIAEALFPHRTVFQSILACVSGALIYRFVIALALNSDRFISGMGLNLGFSIQASDLNLLTAILVGLAMVLPQITRHFRVSKNKRKADK